MLAARHTRGLQVTYKTLSNEQWTAAAVSDRAAMPAKVPGCIHADLLRAGLIEDPNIGFHETESAWVGQTDWEYRCTFSVPDALREHERVDLVCAGLDTIATITLNGVIVGTAANMFHPHRFDVRAALKSGENELVVTIRSPLAHICNEEAQRGKRPVNGDWAPYPYIRKMACNFGWDWGPKVPTVGIWRDIGLHAWSGTRIASVRPLVRRENDERWRVHVHVALEHANSSQPATELRAVAAVGTDTKANAPIPPGASEVMIPLCVSRPRLWWPRGHGDQPLYPLDVRLTGAGPDVTDQWSGRIGFREVRLNTDPDRMGSQFTLEVNGRPVFCRGANWIPTGLFPSEIAPACYRQRVEQAVAANMNMLRVWGGGLYEDAAFYNACDNLGVLVWQDFMFACATYPEEEPYGALVEAEARHNIARLSAHPSVVLWCGGNECIWAYESWGFKERLRPGQTWGRAFYLELLPRLMTELDPTRPYWPNSPYSGSPDIHPLDPDHGNRHTWETRTEGYRESVPRFVSEFGHQSPPDIATLREVLPADELAIDSAAMQHRQRATGGNARQYTEPLGEWFTSPQTFADWHYLAQLLQARAVGLGIEWWRAHMGRCMGVLYWQLNDCWAGHSWSAIDAAGRLKPLWYVTRQAYAPRLLTIQPIGGPPTLFAVNDTDEAWATTARVRRMRLDGEILAETALPVAVAPRASVNIGTLPNASQPQRELLVAEADGLRALWFFGRDQELAYPEARFKAGLAQRGGVYALQVRAETLLRDVVLAVGHVDPHATVGDHCVTLFPGETRTFEIRSAAALTLEALTTPPVFNCANRFGASGD